MSELTTVLEVCHHQRPRSLYVDVQFDPALGGPAAGQGTLMSVHVSVSMNRRQRIDPRGFVSHLPHCIRREQMQLVPPPNRGTVRHSQVAGGPPVNHGGTVGTTGAGDQGGAHVGLFGFVGGGPIGPIAILV